MSFGLRKRSLFLKRSAAFVAVAIALATGAADGAPERRLTVGEYRDRMEAAWLGQMIGVSWGAPVEFKFNGRQVPADKIPSWSDGMINGTFEQDDLYVEMTFLRSMEEYGIDVTIRQAGIDFANSTYLLWHANAAGRRNLRAGIAPPASSHPAFNECANDIDYQIEADYSGILAPGLPQAAVALGEKFGRLMNYGDGVYGGQFVGAMYAEAFFEKDPEAIVRRALRAIPAKSRYAEMVRDVLDLHARHPADFDACWRAIADKYAKDAGCGQQGIGSGINATLNGAQLLMGLLYGEGDIAKTCRYAIRGGWDTDCNASSACGVLCAALGKKSTEAYAKGLKRDVKFSYTNYSFDELLAVSEKLARALVVRFGGRIEKTSAGETFVLPDVAPTPSAFVTFARPGPVEGGRYTQDEMDRILYQPYDGMGLQMGLKSVPKRRETAGNPSGVTKVMFFFDTEDFTCDESSDAIRETARILTDEGVRGEYNIVGYLARELVRNRRQDVIDALRPHAIGTQTLGHSVHPTICEMTDMEDYATAYRNALTAEAEGVGMLKAAFGLEHVDYAVPPGNSWSYASLYVFADLGMTFYGGGGFGDLGEKNDVSEGLVPPGLKRWGMWYCNLFQLPYGHLMAIEELIPGDRDWKLPDIDRVLDESAKRDFMVYCLHPHIALKPAHWDGPNYLGHNRVEWGKWIQISNRPPEATAAFYRNFRAFVRRVKEDPRFEVTDTLLEKGRLKPRTAIRPADVPAIRESLAKDFGAVSSPGSWCLYDVFQAACAFLRGEKEYLPGKAYGFLARPVGVTQPTVVRTADLRAAAAKLPRTGFLPTSIDVGGTVIGPRDFLEAALEALATGVETVRLAPRDPLGSFAKCPSLETVDIKGGWCIHSPDLNGKLLDERLKLQLWTLRYE